MSLDIPFVATFIAISLGLLFLRASWKRNRNDRVEQHRRRRDLSMDKAYRKTSQRKHNSSYATKPNTETTPSREEDDFTASAVVSAVTGSELLGFAAGGSLSGAIVGGMLGDDDTDSDSSSSSGWDQGGSDSCDFD